MSDPVRNIYKGRFVAKEKLVAAEALIAELEAENQRLRELGGKIADELDACRSQLCKMVLGGGE